MSGLWYRRFVHAVLSLVTLLVFPFLIFSQGSPNVQYLGSFNPYAEVMYNDCWGYTAPDGREYALLGVRNGTSIVDITNVPTFDEIAFIPSVTSAWKDIKTYRTYAYVVTDQVGQGIQIIDLSMLPDTAFLVNTFSGSDLTSHNLSIDTTAGILYAEGGAGVVRVVSLADPENPAEITATFGGLAQCHDIFAQNNRLYVSEGSWGSIGIYDVSNPAQPDLLKRFLIPNSGYVHNAWASADGALLMTTEETRTKTVKLWNISDLNAISMTDEFLASPDSLAHNTHIKGSYAYISHYKQGLRIVEISNPNSISEAGYYNTYNSSLAGNFHGAWGAFPFFDSGKILISDMESGLFVVFFAGAVVSVQDEGVHVPASFSLRQNYPNPFNPATLIPFELPEAGRVRLTVHDLLGREVAILIDGSVDAGFHSVPFDAGVLPSGPYFYRLQTLAGTKSGKMVLLR